MNFYLEWKKCLHNIEENKKYIKRFLDKDEESLKVFKDGTTEELISVCKFLLEIPLSNLLYCIDEDRKCTSDMIIQYSNLNHALIDVPRVLKFSENPKTFSELGKIIIKAKKDGACKKYGENHAKVAQEVSMVQLERKGAFIVSNTAFGNFSVSLSEDNRTELVKRLMLRNEFIQKIIYLAKQGLVNYKEVAGEILKETTANRRKSNVREVMNLILKDNELSNHIVW